MAVFVSGRSGLKQAARVTRMMRDQNKSRLTLGLDASTVSTGWAILKPQASGEAAKRGRSSRPEAELVACGALRGAASRKPSRSERIVAMAGGLRRVIEDYRPTELAIESAFVFLNSRTALALGEVRGALILVAAESGLPISEYSPALIKQQIAGSGRASKEEVAQAIGLRLGIETGAMIDDTTDAIACALCHLEEQKLLARGLVRSAFTRRRKRKRPSRIPRALQKKIKK